MHKAFGWNPASTQSTRGPGIRVRCDRDGQQNRPAHGTDSDWVRALYNAMVKSNMECELMISLNKITNKEPWWVTVIC